MCSKCLISSKEFSNVQLSMVFEGWSDVEWKKKCIGCHNCLNRIQNIGNLLLFSGIDMILFIEGGGGGGCGNEF